jgi:chemotaxis family two-component system sensor histidine kinase/response regulator PixL
LYTCALIVEDDAATRAAMVLLLQAEGHVADAVPDGRQALDYLRSHQPPRLVLLDLRMPVMDGWQFLEEKRQDPALAPIPTVVATAAAFERCPDALRALGAADVLLKPIDPDELLAVVGRYC